LAAQVATGPQGKINALRLDLHRCKLAGSFGDNKMTIEQSELEREMVPIADRCFRGCGTRAVLSDGISNFCAKCALSILKSEATRLPRLAA
jgi:hypothetical protein